MKTNLPRSLFHAACKGKNKMVMALLIFTMVVAGIMAPREAKAEEVTVSIYAYSWNFNIQDRNGNILFETIGGELTQLNTDKIEYELWRDSNIIPPEICFYLIQNVTLDVQIFTVLTSINNIYKY